jgi:hypothetical protein
LQRRNDFAHVIADQTKPGVLGVFLDDSPQRELRVFGHGIALVEDDQLEPLASETHRARERLDLVSDDVDAAICAMVLAKRFRGVFEVRVGGQSTFSGKFEKKTCRESARSGKGCGARAWGASDGFERAASRTV